LTELDPNLIHNKYVINYILVSGIIGITPAGHAIPDHHQQMLADASTVLPRYRQTGHIAAHQSLTKGMVSR